MKENRMVEGRNGRILARRQRGRRGEGRPEGKEEIGSG